jgi:hypothetical protein
MGAPAHNVPCTRLDPETGNLGNGQKRRGGTRRNEEDSERNLQQFEVEIQINHVLPTRLETRDGAQ